MIDSKVKAELKTRINHCPAVVLLIVCCGVMLPIPANAQSNQPITTLRNPLIPGQPSSPPGVCPPEGPSEIPGQGPTPAPVTPGMGGPPTLLPWNTGLPADQIDLDTSQIPLPITPNNQSPPGALGPSLAVPAPPSTPGADPGIAPGTNSGFLPPVALTSPGPAGGLFGLSPIQRWGGQTTRDFGCCPLNGSTTYDFGQRVEAVSPVFRSTSQDGPRARGCCGSAPNLPAAQATQDLYGNRQLFKGSTRALMTVAPY